MTFLFWYVKVKELGEIMVYYEPDVKGEDTGPGPGCTLIAAIIALVVGITICYGVIFGA